MNKQLARYAMLMVTLGLAAPLWAQEAMPWPVVAHWTMDGVEGGTLPDTGPNGIDGQVNGGGTPLETVEGVNGSAIAFPADGTSWIDLPPAEAVDQLEAPMTIAAWVKPNAGAKEGDLFSLKWDSVHSGYRLRYAGKLYFSLGNGQETVWLASEQTLAPDAWTHVAATYDGQALRLFINGAVAGEMAFPDAAIAMQEAVHPAVIGNYVGTKEAYAFDGAIDELVILGQALTATEVGQLAQMTAEPR